MTMSNVSLPDCEVHGSNGKERERMHLDHDQQKHAVQHHLDETWSMCQKSYELGPQFSFMAIFLPFISEFYKVKINWSNSIYQYKEMFLYCFVKFVLRRI